LLPSFESGQTYQHTRDAEIPFLDVTYYPHKSTSKTCHLHDKSKWWRGEKYPDAAPRENIAPAMMMRWFFWYHGPSSQWSFLRFNHDHTPSHAPKLAPTNEQKAFTSSNVVALI
jgi:hypothetical protein